MTIQNDEDPSHTIDALENPPLRDTSCATDLVSSDTVENAPTQDTNDHGTRISLSLEDVVTRGRSSYPDLNFTVRRSKDTDLLEVTQTSVYNVPEVGYVSMARVVLYPTPNSDSYSYDVQILLTSVQKGEVQSTEETLRICHIISTEGAYKFCPGLNVTEYYEQYHSAIGYHLQSVRLWDKPFKRVDSVNCLLWHKLNSNARMRRLAQKCCVEHVRGYVLTLITNVRRSVVSPAIRLKRQQPSPQFKLKYLSPASTLKRKTAAQKNDQMVKQSLPVSLSLM